MKLPCRLFTLFATQKETVMRLLRLKVALASIAALLVFGFAQTARAQNSANQLSLSNNYFVTGDYVVGGVGLRGLGVNGFATGIIHIPDQNSVPATGVPAGADIVAAFLYWETAEKDKSTFAGQKGFFNGFAITGNVLGNNTAPPSWSSGGCAGASSGTTTLRAYRADVRPFLPLDANGKIQTPNSVTLGSYRVSLADSGSHGGGTPLTLGASLVIIWRVLSPAVPLTSIVLYDGAVAPNNSSSTMSQLMQGFYQAAASPAVKITHIVGDGQTNKTESVALNGVNLPSLYAGPPFPGFYNGSWDNPTWFGGNSPINTAVAANDASETTSVGPNGPGSGCVDWGVIVFSTTVANPNLDGLLGVWKTPPSGPPGYTDVISNQFVALPGASTSAQDVFVEIDYLTLRDPNGNILHSHLPKQLALDVVGDAFAKKNINIHFDVGAKYNGNNVCKLTPAAFPNQLPCPDPYIIQGGTGGNEIPESALVCTDSTTLCQFPDTAAVGWKEGLLFVKNNATVPGTNVPLGNFQFGRKDSYHYVVFGHALGAPRSFWTAFGATLQQNSTVAKLTSIVVSTVNSVTITTVTIQSPPGLVKPGDCPNAAIPACSDANADRVTVAGALEQPALNGTYHFTNLSSSIDGNNATITTFNITTTGVANGTYNFDNEPRLAVMYLGPTSSSGHSDVGGGDTEITFGLWPADDVSGCQADPSVPLNSGQVYCNDQVGTITAEAGTLLHEMGHTLTLTHGGTFYPDSNNPSVASYALNCNPGFLSSMNYLFQIRGFPDGGIDYSSQVFSSLDETKLNESTGIGQDSGENPALHFTRWYAPPNALDLQLGRFATAHCDGTPILDGAQMVRVDGSPLTEPGGFSGPIDWNNNLIVPDATEPVAWQDVNFNGSTLATPDSPPLPPAFDFMQGFNDWMNVDLLQISARENAFGFSSGTGAGAPLQVIGGGVTAQVIGGGTPLQAIGGGVTAQVIGGGTPLQAIGGGANLQTIGGGAEQDVETACSTADPPTVLTAAMGSKSVLLNWVAPGGPCQVRQYDIWRAKGSFPTLTSVLANFALFTDITAPKGITGTPPVTTFTDTTVKNNTTYTYFVTDKNKQGAQSSASLPVVILVKF